MFPAFLLYGLTALVIAGFEVQAVLLSRLSTWETILYCSAKVLIAFGILYASIQYRVFKSRGSWGYMLVAVLFLWGGSLYSAYNTFAGRLAVSLESGQKQSADLEESASLKASAEQKGNAAQANSNASQRFSESTRKGSLWGQINTARDASRNADESAAMASRAADLKRNSGVTEQQVLTLVSPLKPLPSMIVMALWFSVVLEMLNLLAAAGVAEHFARRRLDTENSRQSGDNVVPLPRPADIRKRSEGGWIDMGEDDAKTAPRVPVTAHENTPVAPHAAIGEAEVHEEQSQPRKPRAKRAQPESEERVTGRVTSAMLKAAIRHLEEGGKPTNSAFLHAGITRSAETAKHLRAELIKGGHIRQEGRLFVVLVSPKPAKKRARKASSA